MSPPSAAPSPRRHRCRTPKSATSPPAAARTVRPRKTDRRCVWRAGNARATSAASASSPATVACRNEPGGSVTCAAPIAIVGGVRISTSSPWRVSRASRCCSATATGSRSCAAGSGPEPRTSTSRPLLAAVIWISSGLPAGFSDSASAQAASSAPCRAGSRIGQSIDRERWRGCWPRRSRPRNSPSLPRRACTVMRRRPAPWASISASTSQSMPACASVSTTIWRFQAR